MTRLTYTSKQIISYAIGFILSVVLTLLAYNIVVRGGFVDYWTPQVLVIILAGLAVLQLAVQLVFFMHLGDEPKPRWKLMSFIFAFIILGVIVFGSMWIMFDLSSRMMMSPTDMIKYMNRQTGL